MGFFWKYFGQAKELSKLGSAVANVKNLLDQYETDPDRSYLLGAAWICKVGILDRIEKYSWAPNYCVYVPINGHQTKMYISEAQLATVGRLRTKVANLYSSSLERTIDDILAGGPSFSDIDSQIPQETREIIL